MRQSSETTHIELINATAARPLNRPPLTGNSQSALARFMTRLEDKLLGFRVLWHFDNRWQLILNRIFFKEHSCLVYRRGNIEFLVDHNAGDGCGARMCIASDLYRRFLPKMKLGGHVSLFDLGANSGGFPLMLLLNGRRLSKLVCVEMSPNTFDRLEYNVRRNVDGEVKLVQGAVCGSRKQLHLSLGKGATSDSIYDVEAAEASTPRMKYVVEGYSFDDLFRSHFGNGIVDICKMDIEGAEYEVLLSSQCDTLRLCRYLIIEIHDAPSKEQQRIIEVLSYMGFGEVDPEDGRATAEHLFQNSNLN